MDNKYLKYYFAIAAVVIVTLIAAITFVLSQPESVPEKTQGAAVTSVAGVCSGNEPATQLCNTSINNLSIQTAFDTAGTLGVDGLATFNGAINFDGLTSYVATGSFTDASTTILAFANPAAVSSTLDFMGLKYTGVATSTHTVVCGTSTNAFGSPTQGIIASGSIPTSTPAYLVNNVTYGQISAGTVTRIVVGPTEYLVCKVSSSHTGAFTESTNTFDGSYVARFSKF